MDKFMLFSLKDPTIEVIQSENLTRATEDLIKNYAFPFGSEWDRCIGSRAVKVFQLGKDSVCLAYTIITYQNYETMREKMYCLASIHDLRDLDKLIQKDRDWIKKAVEPFVMKIYDGKSPANIRSIFQNSLQVETPKVAIRLQVLHWLRAQVHAKTLARFYYSDADSWTECEEYARRLYLSTDWQRKLGRYIRNLPLISRLDFLNKYPSFATLTLSSGEFTDIGIIAIPANPKEGMIHNE